MATQEPILRVVLCIMVLASIKLFTGCSTARQFKIDPNAGIKPADPTGVDRRRLYASKATPTSETELLVIPTDQW